MKDMNKQQLLCLCSLILSAFVSLSLPIQDEDAGPRCLEGERMEEKTQAIMLNRIRQMESVLKLTPQEMKRLRVMINGVIRKKLSTHQEKLGDPTKTTTWNHYLEKALTVQQLATLKEFDLEKGRQRLAAKQRFEVEAQTVNVQAEFAAALLQHNLFLSDLQAEQVLEMLNSYLSNPELPGEEQPTWRSFYESKRDSIDDLLLESQRFFFADQDALRMSKPLSDSSQWQEANCADCHVAAGGAAN